LIAPPAPPTNDQIIKNPALGKLRTDNPYVRFGDLNVVVDLLSQALTNNSERGALARQGADSRYTVAPSVRFGAAPIIQITGFGPTAHVAIQSATTVGQQAATMLGKLQGASGTDPSYQIKSLPLDVPDQAQLQTSGKIRTVVGVLGLGAILLFAAVSTMQGLAERKANRPPKPAAAVPVGRLDPGASTQTRTELPPNGRESGAPSGHAGRRRVEGKQTHTPEMERTIKTVLENT
jgi:hypothetical protein